MWLSCRLQLATQHHGQSGKQGHCELARGASDSTMWRGVGLTCALLCAWIAENHAAYGPAKGHMIAQGSNEADLAANPVPTGVRTPHVAAYIAW